MNNMEQIKFTIESEIIFAFKKRCKSEDISMTSVIRQFMKTCQPTKGFKSKIDTRPHRKKVISEIIAILNDVLANEEQYKNNIPEQFETRYEAADHTCEQLSEAISCLEDAF